MEQDLISFIDSYTTAIKENNAAIFAGAGLSAPAGFVNWKELLRDIAKDLKLSVDKENDLISVAQYHVNEAGGNRSKLNQKLINEFTTTTRESLNHEILASLPIQTYWTTNYDKLIEKSLEAAGKSPDVKITVQNLANNIPKRDAVVYKMHGDVQFPDQAVLTKDDYETYNEKRELFSIALRGDLVSKTFLFLGFSFDDPNLEYILSRIRILLGQNQRTHYCFFKKLARVDFKEEDDFKYASIRQELKANDLKRYGIKALWVDDYNQITEALNAIAQRIKRNNIFISGAADIFKPMTPTEAGQFVHQLSYKIASKNNKIISGYGLGIGSFVINGALDYKLTTNYRHLDDVIILRPFPQVDSGERPMNERWTDYRKSMLDNAGIAIYLFGNKTVDGKIVSSNGMMEEFEIACDRGVVPIPVGATGYAAEELWNKVMTAPGTYYPNNAALLNAIQQLGDKNLRPEDLIAQILTAVAILQNNFN
jgi:hypothetical protein